MVFGGSDFDSLLHIILVDPTKRLARANAINNSPSTEGYLMNSKAEYQQGEVARVVMVRGLAE